MYIVPKFIKVKPIIRRATAEYLKAIGVPLRPLFQIDGPLFMRKLHRVGERLKVHLIPVPSPVEPEKQDYRRTDDMGQSHRSDRKPGFTAQEITDNSLIVLHHTIAHDADYTAPIETFFHLQHRIQPTDLNDRFRYGGVQFLDQVTNQGRVLFVHEDADLDVLAGKPHCTDHFKTSEVRPQQHAATAFRQLPVERV